MSNDCATKELIIEAMQNDQYGDYIKLYNSVDEIKDKPEFVIEQLTKLLNHKERELINADICPDCGNEMFYNNEGRKQCTECISEWEA